MIRTLVEVPSYSGQTVQNWGISNKNHLTIPKSKMTENSTIVFSGISSQNPIVIARQNHFSYHMNHIKFMIPILVSYNFAYCDKFYRNYTA